MRDENSNRVLKFSGPVWEDWSSPRKRKLGCEILRASTGGLEQSKEEEAWVLMEASFFPLLCRLIVKINSLNAFAYMAIKDICGG